jgi:hypothetical protein
MRSICAIYALGMITALSAGMAAPARAGDDIAKLLDDGQTLSDDILAQQRGGTAQPNTAEQSANVSGNVVGSHTVTGDNNFGGFGASQGMITVFQNTGNNVSMQSQTVLNVTIQ